MTALTDKFTQIMRNGGQLTEIVVPEYATRGSVQSCAWAWCERHHPRMKPKTRKDPDNPDVIRVGFVTKSSETIEREEAAAHRSRSAGR